MPKDLYRYFRIEARELLAQITAALERLRLAPLPPEDLRELRRSAHTLKGAAQVVRREDIAQSVHRLESALDVNDISSTASLAEEIAQMLASLDRPAEAAPGISTEIAKNAEGPIPARAGREIETLRVELAELDSLLQAVNQSAMAAAELRSMFGKFERLQHLSGLLQKQIAHENAERRSPHGDMIAEEMLDAIAEARRELEATSDRIEREIRGVRMQAESLRLVEAATVATIVERSVKAAAGAAGKLVEFASSGGEVELDAHVLLAVRDALVQIARNAIAHGIESPAERRAAGKSATGHVRLALGREGNRNIFRVTDDGRGINFEMLRAEAVRRGWLTLRQADETSEHELTEFLLRPGVTTAESPNELAGRGVGLDLVSNTVARLKGELRITAEPGQGTTVELRVPSSMRSASVLIARAGGTTFGIPLDAVRKTASLATLKNLGDRYVIDGRALPMIPLANMLGVDRGMDRGAVSVGIEVVDYADTFLLGVDGLLGIEQIVMVSLPEHMQAEPFVLGAWLDTNGPHLILDPGGLATQLSAVTDGQPQEKQSTAPQLPILVIDDSLTTRMLEQSIFETAGYSVELASSAEDGLSMARQRRYGLFLVDVEMPGMDGFAFVAQVRQEHGLREVPAILVTSRDSAEDRARGQEAGANDYIVKGEFDQRYLLRRVRELMGSR